jgi:protein-S-isoprenylcysteine O-methyltransferase Ste14
MASEYHPTNSRAKGWIMVFLQFFALLILLGWPPHMPQSLVGIILFCFGFLLLAYAVFSMSRNSWSVHPTPNNNGALTQRGPYRFIRHPMYTAVLFVGLGLLISQPTKLKIAAWALLLIVFYFKIMLEESMLSSKYPDYLFYQQRTHRLIPRIW